MKVSQAQKMGGADVQILILSIQDYSLDLKKCHPLQRYTQIQRQEHRHKHIHSLLIKFSVSPVLLWQFSLVQKAQPTLLNYFQITSTSGPNAFLRGDYLLCEDI